MLGWIWRSLQFATPSHLFKHTPPRIPSTTALKGQEKEEKIKSVQSSSTCVCTASSAVRSVSNHRNPSNQCNNSAVWQNTALTALFVDHCWVHNNVAEHHMHTQHCRTGTKIKWSKWQVTWCCIVSFQHPPIKTNKSTVAATSLAAAARSCQSSVVQLSIKSNKSHTKNLSLLLVLSAWPQQQHTSCQSAVIQDHRSMPIGCCGGCCHEILQKKMMSTSICQGLFAFVWVE